MTSLGAEERVIALGQGLAAIPERLLLAHSRGEVLFIAGAGISRPASLPDFRELVPNVYAELDAAAHAVMASVPEGACNQWSPDLSSLTHQQAAEVRRFITGDFDVVLGMIERRMDGQGHEASTVRRTITKKLRPAGARPAPIHRALMRLADRGGVHTIATTNFDLLLEKASRQIRPGVPGHSLGAIPRPGRNNRFGGVLHIHGALDRDAGRDSDLVVSDQDLGEFYLSTPFESGAVRPYPTHASSN
jgi:SIR2-like protein